MLFNSYEFIFGFLPATFFIYFILSRYCGYGAKLWLTFSSLFFYSWWNIIYLPLILLSIIFNFIITKKIISHRDSDTNQFTKKFFLQAGLLGNVGLLIYFKYMDFFISNANVVFGSELGYLNLALPLAISFFTLQQIAFLIDTYEGLVEEKKLLDYMIFVTFFPQLIAGPIVHHKEMMPQFIGVENRIKNNENVALGTFIFSIGLFKKVVIADSFAVWATNGFDVASTLNLFEAWATSLSYTFQLYFDFSGYTDMAIGVALLFNIRLPINFNSPYKATGMIDFWQRWHITLSRFITTYIYTPLIRSFDSLTLNKAMFATVITFLVAGLWHGASWMFVIFGGLHGLGVISNHYWRKLRIKIPKVLAWFITFNFVNITFVFFRANDFESAGKVLVSMFSLDNVVLPGVLASKLVFLSSYGVQFGGFLNHLSAGWDLVFWLIAGLILSLVCTNTMEKSKSFKPDFRSSLMFTLLFTCSFYKLSGYSEFLYFRF